MRRHGPLHPAVLVGCLLYAAVLAAIVFLIRWTLA